MSRLAFWLPPLAWMAAIMWFSTGDFSAASTGSFIRPLLEWLLPWAHPAQLDAIHGLGRKAGHLTEYAILAALWFLTLRRERRLSPRAAAWAAFLVAVGWAFLDELHQSTDVTRTGSAVDVAIDGAGALAAAMLARHGWRGVTAGATTALLWAAAGGGALVIATNLASGVGSGVLWLTVPLAAALLARRWRRRATRSAAWR